MRGRRTELPDPDAIVAAYRAGRTLPELVDATPGATYGRVWRLLAARVPPGERRRHLGAAISAAARRRYSEGGHPWSKGRGNDGTAAARPVWSDRVGEYWPTLAAAAAAVGRSRTGLALAIAEGRSCAGRRWYEERPQWAVDADAAAEAARVAAIVVRTYPRDNVYQCRGLPADWRGCEQRWAERKAVTA
jgi:hypothetical protein